MASIGDCKELLQGWSADSTDISARLNHEETELAPASGFVKVKGSRTLLRQKGASSPITLRFCLAPNATGHSPTASERAKRKYHEEKCAGPEGHKRPIAKELVFFGTGFLPVSAFPFEYTDEQQGQEQGNDCRDYHLGPAFESFTHLTI